MNLHYINVRQWSQPGLRQVITCLLPAGCHGSSDIHKHHTKNFATTVITPADQWATFHGCQDCQEWQPPRHVRILPEECQQGTPQASEAGREEGSGVFAGLQGEELFWEIEQRQNTNSCQNQECCIYLWFGNHYFNILYYIWVQFHWIFSFPAAATKWRAAAHCILCRPHMGSQCDLLTVCWYLIIVLAFTDLFGDKNDQILLTKIILCTTLF